MFPYSDPVAGNVLQANGALQEYQSLLHKEYRAAGRIPRSGFVPLEALVGIQPGNLSKTTVSWLAFPRSVTGTPQDIDSDRFAKQDEYVEWRVERRQDGTVSAVVFSTEFPEYYEALAAQGLPALQAGISEVTGQVPTATDLFGPGFNPAGASPLARQRQFRSFAEFNVWNNGSRDILFLTQRFNTLSALFNLLGHCGIENTAIPAAAVCDAVGGFCGSGRNSDPFVCLAAQDLRRNRRAFSLTDAAGVRILRLDGIWKLNGQQIDISSNAVWTITRGGRRAVLKVTPQLTMGDDPITSGAQISTRLKVGAEVVSVDENFLPDWAKTGQESTRRTTD